MRKDIDRDEVQRLIQSGAQLVEVLPAEEYNDAHLPGAINLPLKKLNKKTTKDIGALSTYNDELWIFERRKPYDPGSS